MTGKEKCKLMKKLRAEIAKVNNIPGFEYKECPYGDDCPGTCPACDAEEQALSDAIDKLENPNLDVFNNDSPFFEDEKNSGSVNMVTQGLIVAEDHIPPMEPIVHDEDYVPEDVSDREPGRVLPRRLRGKVKMPNEGKRRKGGSQAPEISEQEIDNIKKNFSTPGYSLDISAEDMETMRMKSIQESKRDHTMESKEPRGLRKLIKKFKKKD